MRIGFLKWYILTKNTFPQAKKIEKKLSEMRVFLM